MDTQLIRAVQLKEGICRGGNCHEMGAFLERTRLAVDFEEHPDSQGGEPALVVVRCVSDARVVPALAEMRARWPGARFLGIFCDPPDPDGEPVAKLARWLDDFVWCPLREADLLPRVERLLPFAASGAPSGIRELKARRQLDAFIGESPLLCALLEKIPPIAACDATCVVSGETGTGKELVARAIHYGGPRRNKPFVPVNCGALPDHLFENEMFGHQRGAYTDASSNEAGLLAVAHEGSLFLDEVDSLSPQAQVKLLRFLQEREYRPLGSSRPVKADVRVLAATNADLRRLVEARQFRDDLYHRLNVVYLRMPSLRERSEDIPLLAAHFVERFGRQHRPGAAIRLSDSALQKLVSYSWPGNIRELEAVIQRAIILLSHNLLCSADIDLPGGVEPQPSLTAFRAARNQAIGEFERNYLLRMLEEHGGNVSRAARSAGKDRRGFQRLLQKHNVPRRAFGMA